MIYGILLDRISIEFHFIFMIKEMIPMDQVRSPKTTPACPLSGVCDKEKCVGCGWDILYPNGEASL